MAIVKMNRIIAVIFLIFIFVGCTHIYQHAYSLDFSRDHTFTEKKHFFDTYKKKIRDNNFELVKDFENEFSFEIERMRSVLGSRQSDYLVASYTEKGGIKITFLRYSPYPNDIGQKFLNENLAATKRLFEKISNNTVELIEIEKK